MAQQSLNQLLLNACEQPGTSPSAVEALLNKGADINLQGHAASNRYKEYTPLIATLWQKPPNLELAQYLIEKGANVNLTSADASVSPLFICCTHRNLEALRILLEAGADPNLSIKHVYKPFPLTSLLNQDIKTEEYLPFCELLFEFGADPNAFNDKGLSPLLSISWLGRAEIVDYFCQKGGNPASFSIPEKAKAPSPLFPGHNAFTFVAAQSTAYELLPVLAKYGDVNAVNASGKHVLYYLIGDTTQATFAQMVGLGANVRHRHENGSLMEALLAARENGQSCLEQSLKTGTSWKPVELTEFLGLAALHLNMPAFLLLLAYFPTSLASDLCSAVAIAEHPKNDHLPFKCILDGSPLPNLKAIDEVCQALRLGYVLQLENEKLIYRITSYNACYRSETTREHKDKFNNSQNLEPEQVEQRLIEAMEHLKEKIALLEFLNRYRVDLGLAPYTSIEELVRQQNPKAYYMGTTKVSREDKAEVIMQYLKAGHKYTSGTKEGVDELFYQDGRFIKTYSDHFSDFFEQATYSPAEFLTLIMDQTVPEQTSVHNINKWEARLSTALRFFGFATLKQWKVYQESHGNA